MRVKSVLAATACLRRRSRDSRRLEWLASLIAAGLLFQSCAHANAPQVAGTWVGPMLLQTKSQGPVLVQVQIVLRQLGPKLQGSWSTTPSEVYRASGDVTGRIFDVAGRHQVSVGFTFLGKLPGVGAIDDTRCEGTARASGQLTFATTLTTDGRPRESRQPPRWALRLKAFDGVDFGSCGAVGYATWTVIPRRT